MSTIQNTSSSNSHYWPIIIFFFVGCLVTGVIGYEHYFSYHKIDHDLSRSIYKTFQLYTFEGGDMEGFIPFELQLARFLAPFVSLGAVILALLELLRDQRARWKIARLKNHVIILGFGKKGIAVMQECRERNVTVLVIDNDPENPDLHLLKERGCHFLLADATQEKTLRQARINKANMIYLLSGEDHINIEATLQIFDIMKEDRQRVKNPLKCILHLQKQTFLNTLKGHKLVTDMKDAFDLKIFNVYENSARYFFLNHPPDWQGIKPNSKKRIQVFIFGFGKNGEALALETAMTGHYANHIKPRVIIVDRMNEARKADFLRRYPTFETFCDLEYIVSEGDSPQLLNQLQSYFQDLNCLNSMVVCFGDKTQNLMLGLQLEEVLDMHRFQIFIRTYLNEKEMIDYSQELKIYGATKYSISHHAIFGEELDLMAKAVHKNYLSKKMEALNCEKNPADCPWEKLMEDLKDSNRKASDHIGVKMRAIGCEIVPMQDPRPPYQMSPKELEMLAELEHRRWNAERSLNGWTFSKKGNKKNKETPYLIKWEGLTEEIKDYDRDAVRDIPLVLEKVGKKGVKRELVE